MFHVISRGVDIMAGTLSVPASMRLLSFGLTSNRVRYKKSKGINEYKPYNATTFQPYRTI